MYLSLRSDLKCPVVFGPLHGFSMNRYCGVIGIIVIEKKIMSLSQAGSSYLYKYFFPHVCSVFGSLRKPNKSRKTDCHVVNGPGYSWVQS